MLRLVRRMFGGLGTQCLVSRPGHVPDGDSNAVPGRHGPGDATHAQLMLEERRDGMTPVYLRVNDATWWSMDAG